MVKNIDGMKVGDLVRETKTIVHERTPDLGLIIEIDSHPAGVKGSARYLVQFEEGAFWIPGHHMESINESE